VFVPLQVGCWHAAPSIALSHVCLPVAFFELAELADVTEDAFVALCAQGLWAACAVPQAGFTCICKWHPAALCCIVSATLVCHSCVIVEKVLERLLKAVL
jgi:hypothetical protein